MNNSLEKIYSEYVTSVSSPLMAASLELCKYIQKVCNEHEFKRIVDLGSGITSYVVRQYQALNDDVIVYSVDDNKQWLDKSKNFVNNYELNVDNFVLGIENIPTKYFDLIIYDYGRMPVRSQMLEYALCNLGTLSAYYILDDCHKNGYYKQLKALSERNNLELSELLETKDDFGRYASLIKF